MKSTNLGEQYVRFSVKGLKEAEKGVKETSTKVTRTWADLREKLSKGFGNVLKGAFAISAPLAGLLGFAKAASQGTREGEQMATSWMYLTKVIGSMFAPAMRAGTMLILKIADAVHALSPATKAWIVLLSLGAAGFLALSGAVTVAIMAFSGLAAAAGIAWTVITSPVVLTIAAVIALGAALLVVIGYIANFATDGKESATSWVDAMLTGAKLVKDGVVKVLDFLMEKFAKWGNMLTGNAASLADAIGLDETAAKLRNLHLDPSKMRADLSEFSNDANEAIEKAKKWVEANVPKMKEIPQKIRDAVKNLKEMPGLIGQLLKGSDGQGMKFKAQLSVGFESLQGTFDRLQESFAKGTEGDKLDQIRDELKGEKEILNKILDKIGLGSVVS